MYIYIYIYIYIYMYRPNANQGSARLSPGRKSTRHREDTE